MKKLCIFRRLEVATDTLDANMRLMIISTMQCHDDDDEDDDDDHDDDDDDDDDDDGDDDDDVILGDLKLWRRDWRRQQMPGEEHLLNLRYIVIVIVINNTI